MSIENNLQKMVDLLTSIDGRLAALMEQQPAVPATPDQPTPVAQDVPQQPAVPATLYHEGVASPDPTATPATPATPAISEAPFTDNPGMVNYVMEAYNQLGPEKGARIQEVMSQLGLTNINDTKPEQYAALYQGIEALKGA